MELLPPEIMKRILSHIPYYELLKLRLVSKWFDDQIKIQSKSISSVKFFERRDQFDWPGSTNHDLHSNKLQVYVGVDFDVSKNLIWVKNNFPAIRAIFFHVKEPVALSLLIPFAKKLKYFRAAEVNVDVPYDTVKDIMDMFPALQAFRVTVYTEPFCQRLWAGRSNLHEWRNTCDHSPPCTEAGHPPTEGSKWIDVTDYSPRQVNLTTIASSLEELTLKEFHGTPPILRLPKLKRFELETHKEALGEYMFLNFLGDSPSVRSIDIYAYDTTSAVTLTFLSLVNSLSQIEYVHLLVEEVYQVDSVESTVFLPCEKPKLNQLYLNLATCTPKHFSVVKSLIQSSKFISMLEINSYKDIEFDLSLRYLQQSRLSFYSDDPAHLKEVFDVLDPRYYPLTTDLDLSTNIGVDASFVDLILKFENLEYLTGRFTGGCIQRWLPLFVVSDNKKNLQLSLDNLCLNTIAPETHDLLIESEKNGSLEQFELDMPCSMGEPCFCALRGSHISWESFMLEVEQVMAQYADDLD